MAQAIVCLLMAAALVAGTASSPAAGAVARLNVVVDNFRSGGAIFGAYAYCVPAKVRHTVAGPNRSPAISWSRGPAGTASYAIIVVDTDVPTVFTNANKEGQTIPASMKRRDFYHFVLVDIPPSITHLAEGADSKGAAAKPAGPTPNGVRGLNDYGDGRAGYDGPCPPWNDAIMHHYHFRVYALNVPHLLLPAGFTGPNAVKAIQEHVVATGEVVGLYTQNPAVARTLRR